MMYPVFTRKYIPRQNEVLLLSRVGNTAEKRSEAKGDPGMQGEGKKGSYMLSQDISHRRNMRVSHLFPWFPSSIPLRSPTWMVNSTGPFQIAHLHVLSRSCYTWTSLLRSLKVQGKRKAMWAGGEGV